MKAKDNPFSVDRIQRIRYRPQEGDWDELCNRLENLNYRAAIVGPHGFGKSTLLEDIGERLDAQGFECKHLRLNEETPRFDQTFLHEFFATLDNRDMILFDGAELLSWLAWRRFLSQSRNSAGLIITTHQPCRLPVLLTCETSVQLLREIIHELAGEMPTVRESFVDDLYERHQGNLRDALREMYDCFARKTTITESSTGVHNHYVESILI